MIVKQPIVKIIPVVIIIKFITAVNCSDGSFGSCFWPVRFGLSSHVDIPVISTFPFKHGLPEEIQFGGLRFLLVIEKGEIGTRTLCCAF